jgi:hypothetical protein
VRDEIENAEVKVYELRLRYYYRYLSLSLKAYYTTRRLRPQRPHY